MMSKQKEYTQLEYELHEQYNANHPGNWILQYDVRSTHQDSSERSWFNNQYNHLVTAWQRTVMDVNAGRRTNDYFADMIRFKYIPFVKNFIQEVEKRDLPYKKEKLQILRYRLTSLKHMETYLRTHDEKAYEVYDEYDTKFREMIDRNIDIVK